MKNDTEEQAEILDLDSHKVQTHRYEDEYNMRMHQHTELHHHMQMQPQHHHPMQHHQPQSPVHSINALSRPHSMTQSYDYHSSMSPMGPVDNVASMQDQQSQFMLGQLPLAGVEPPRHPGSPIISSTQPMPSHQMHQPHGTGLMPTQNPKPPTMGNQSWKSNEARRPKTYNCTACNKWFTSSGHLKRHYNTTLHKNAVKQSNQPDPANMPISAHHHPGRDATTGGRTGSGSGGPTSRTSPELSSSSSPPNLMAGPSGEATRGLLHTPTSIITTTTTTSSSSSAHIYNNNNHISSSSSNNEATPLQALQEQKFLQHQIHQQHHHHQLHQQHHRHHQQQQHHHHQQPQSSGIVMASDLYQSNTGQTSMMVLHSHSHHQAPPAASHQHPHHQSISSPSPQQQQQKQHQQQQTQQPTQSQQVQQHHLQMDSPHQALSSPMSPMQQHPAAHMSSPSPVGTGPQQQPSAHLSQPQSQQQPPPPASHHHMNSPSPTMVGATQSAHQATSPPPPVSMMGGTTMPHQPYPNALPPHVTTITNIPGLLRSITSPPITTGNDELNHHSQQQQRDHVLPAFGTFASHHQQQQLQHEKDRELKQPLPSFTQFGYMATQHPAASRQVNVGGLSPEEAQVPSHIKFEAVDRYDSYENYENYENYRNSSSRYECMGSNSGNDVDMMQVPADSSSAATSAYNHLQERQQYQQSDHQCETNNNDLLHASIKEELNTSIPLFQSLGKKGARGSKATKAAKVETKEHQVTSTNMGSHYISENGLHKCIECDKVFNKACYLTQHNKSFHSGDKPFKCNQCGKRFPHEYQHAEHLQKHAGDKPYKCEVCPKQFNHKTDLRRHMCLHTGEKPYACDNCGKGFIRKDHMMKHVETHKKKNNLHKIHLRA